MREGKRSFPRVAQEYSLLPWFRLRQKLVRSPPPPEPQDQTRIVRSRLLPACRTKVARPHLRRPQIPPRPGGILHIEKGELVDPFVLPRLGHPKLKGRKARGIRHAVPFPTTFPASRSLPLLPIWPGNPNSSLKHLFSQLAEPPVIVMPHVSVRLAKFDGDFCQCEALKKVQSQGLTLALGQRFKYLL